MSQEPLPRSATPPVQAPARRVPKIALSLGVVALLAAVALISRGSPESATAGAPQAPAPSTPSTDGSGASAGQGQKAQGREREKGHQFKPTTCWQDLERFNETVTLDTFRAWAGPLLASKDPLVIQYLKERLSELIGNDEGRANEVLGWAREAPPAEFKVLLAGIRGAEVLPKLAARLTALGLDESLSLDRRAGFIDELQRMPRLDQAALDKLTTFAKDASSGEAGWVTARAIGRVMKEDMARTGNAKPYLDKLLTIGTESLDEQVRYLALEMEMHNGAPLDSQSTERLAKVLATEGSGGVREVAAHDLANAQDKKQVLEIYAKAFATERDLCVRWALFRFAARAAGKDALPVMAEMAVADPRFQGDYQDFERLYASGILDFDRLWLALPSQDPHGCLDRHD